MSNIYDQLETKMLIRAIQRTAILLLKHEKEKDIPSTKLSRVKKELSMMRMEIVPRLRALNRMDPLFFPKGCKVTYQPEAPPNADEWAESVNISPQEGSVMYHLVGHVVVLLKGEFPPVMIKPQYLKIKFIRP